MKEGTVRQGKDPSYGFITAKDDGTKTFVHRSSYPDGKDVLDGDEITYDVVAGLKGPRATNVAIIKRGTSKPMPTPAPGSPTNAPSPVQSQAIDVEWNPGKPTSHELLLILTLIGSKGRSGIEVGLKANGAEMKDPLPNPSPDGKGNVIFVVPFVPRTNMYKFAAEIIVDGKVVKTTSYVWEKRTTKNTVHTPAAASPVTDAEKKLPEIEVVNPPRDSDPTTGVFLVNIATRKNGKKANRNFTALSDHTVEIQQSHPAGLAVVTTFTHDTIGHYPLYVNFDGIMAKIVFRLDNGQEAVVWLRK